MSSNDRPAVHPARPPRLLDRGVGASVFGSNAAGYHRARLGYPPALFEAIAARVPPGARVLEVGPGTGLATRDLLDRLDAGALLAVEADPGMASHLAATVDDPRLIVVTAGFAEADPRGPFDLICAAASFHWLEPVSALAKMRMLLRPGGTVALWWNTYRQRGADAFADAVTPLLDGLTLPPSEGAEGHYSLDVALHRDTLARAGFVAFQDRLFRRERQLDTAQVRALYATYSYIRALPDARREAVLDAIAALADDRFGGKVPNVVLTALYLASAPD